MKTSDIRKNFLHFFESKEHRVVKSDSLIPASDPSLLFTGAGMNQFKDYFLGVKQDLKRACSSQKCLRTGDLDNVGRTPYHHSFFEMLGNFSFGDYFKEEAISWAWEFLTKILRISPDRLKISVYHDDTEALLIWTKKIGINDSLIAKLGDGTNFWPANAPKEGPNGPCGPCSEIYYDQGNQYSGVSKNQTDWFRDESGRFAEIWNLVFTQYDRQDGGVLKPLAGKNIDTGAGLERLACMMQGKRNNFEIDLFQPLIRKAQEVICVSRDVNATASISTIVDHARAVTFAIADGAFPSNDGRGYVIRKLIRRSVWRAKRLGENNAFLYLIIPAVIEVMKDQYPELIQAEKSVVACVRQEEEKFIETLENGLGMFEKVTDKLKKKNQKIIPGNEAFMLYDTYGFPDELIRSMAAEHGLLLDETGFQVSMEEQRKRAKESTKISDSIFSIDLKKKEIAAIKPTRFVGYDRLTGKGNVLWYETSRNRCSIALDETPFYPEGGGQVGDRGMIKSKHFECKIADVKRVENVIIHIGELVSGSIRHGESVEASVNVDYRLATMRHHTATHLLQAALREILGPHIRQMGSLVNAEKLRFDFTHQKPLTDDEISRIEKRINGVIVSNLPVEHETLNYQDAVKKGALAFFGDKYEEQVRVINVDGFSLELCGGTHCQRTGDIGSFVILNESSVASGTRRIEACAGMRALEENQSMRNRLVETARMLKVTPQEVGERVKKIIEGAKKSSTQSKTIDHSTIDQALTKAEKIGNLHLIKSSFDGVDLKDLRSFADELRKKAVMSIMLLVSNVDGKLSFIISITKDLEKSKFDASLTAKILAQRFGGSAGGRKELAQGGGAPSDRLSELLSSFSTIVQELGAD